MRWTAVVLSLLVASIQLALFGLAQRQLPTALLDAGPTADAPWLRWLWAIGWAAPWLAGAALLACGRARRGAAVLLTVMLLTVTAGLGNLTSALTLPVVGADVPLTAGFQRIGGLAAWVLALATGLTAWFGRPRDAWRVAAPGPVGWYVTLAICAWLPSAFQQTAFAPPGSPRRFVETDAGALSGLDAAGSIAGAVVVAFVLWAAPRLRPEVAGAVLLTYAVPTLLADLGGVLRVANEEFVIFTPSGVLGLAGVLGLIAAGTWWVQQPAIEAHAVSGAPPPPDGEPA